MFFYADNMMNFAFAESLDDEDYIPGGYGLFGVPFDSTTSYMAGSRYGPKAIREASYNFESYNMRFNKDVSAVCYDIGDVQVNNGNYMATNMMIKDTVKSLLEMDLKPIAMGGEHTITNGVLGGIYEYDEDLYHDMSIIHFDAHFDMRDEYMGEKFSHAAVLRRLHELKPKDITQLGIRSAQYDEFEYVKTHSNINYFTSYDIKDNIQNVLNYLDDIENPLYISVDIDVLDPAYAPSVGTPASCGITPFELEDMMAIISKKDVIGLDVVEVSSNTIGDPTSVNAAKVIYDFLTHKS